MATIFSMSGRLSRHAFVLICGLSSHGLDAQRRAMEAGLKKAEEVMEILQAHVLPGSLHAAAALAGCNHKTVGMPSGS